MKKVCPNNFQQLEVRTPEYACIHWRHVKEIYMCKEQSDTRYPIPDTNEFSENFPFNKILLQIFINIEAIFHNEKMPITRLGQLVPINQQ